MLELYENIRKYRKELGMSQAELAKRTGYTDRSSIAKIEKGDVDLPQSKIMVFAKALGVAPGELMGDVNPDAKVRKLGTNGLTMRFLGEGATPGVTVCTKKGGGLCLPLLI